MAVVIDRSILDRSVPLISITNTPEEEETTTAVETGRQVTPKSLFVPPQSSEVVPQPLESEQAERVIPSPAGRLNREQYNAIFDGSIQQAPDVVARAIPLVNPNERIVEPTMQKIDSDAGLPTAEESWYEDGSMVARAVLDGLAFGFSDEIAAGISATFQAIADPDRGWDEIYNETMDDLEEDRRIYAEAHPYANIGLQLVGGLLSPANFAIKLGLAKGASLLATGADKAKVVTGLGQTRVQRALQQMEQRTPLLAGTERAAQQVSTGRRIGQAIGGAAVTGAVGGAIYGAGVSEQRGEGLLKSWKGRLDDATTGAAYGVALAPLAGLFPAVGSFVSKRRNAQTLQTGKDFVPIPLTEAEPGVYTKAVDWVYKNLVSKALVSKSLMDKQSQRWLTPAMNRVENTLSNLQKARLGANSVAKAIEKTVKEETENLKITRRKQSAQKTLNIKDTKAQAERAARENRKAKIQTLASEADEIAVRTEQGFRSQAYHQAIPKRFPERVRFEIQNLINLGNYESALSRLRDAWNKYGYDFIGNRSFKINPDTWADDIWEAMARQPALLGTVRERGLENISFLLNEFVARFTKNGVIKGTDLKVLRNEISSYVNQAMRSGEANDRFKADVFLAIKSKLDDTIERQLPTELIEKNAFQLEKDAWLNTLYLEEATAQAFNNRGAFTPRDWRQASRNLDQRKEAVAKTPLAKEAREAEDVIAAANKAINDAKIAVETASVNELEILASNTRAALQQERDDLADEILRIQRKEGVRLTEQLSRANRAGVIKLESELKAIDEQIEGLKVFQDNLKALMPQPSQTSGLSRGSEALISTYALSFMTNILGGIATGVGLTSRASQRILMGQTAWQEKLNNMLQRGRQQNVATLTGVTTSGAGMLSKDIVSPMIKNATDERKRQMYRAMERNGSLERFAEKYPREFEILKEAVY